VIKYNAALCSEYLREAISATVMQETLFNDTVSLLDKPVIDGSDIPAAITAGLQDAERFFGDARVDRPEDGASTQVGALSVLMYYLTLCRERPISGYTHFCRLERWASKLHRQLKKMFHKYDETCCYTMLNLDNEVATLEAGSIRIQWAEFPFVENEDESPLDGENSRPSSGASRVVQTSRDDSIVPKDLPTTMLYSLARPPPPDGAQGEPDEKPIIGMLQGTVEQVEELVRSLQEINHLVEEHKRNHEGDTLDEVLQAQVMDGLRDVCRFFQAESAGGVDSSEGLDLKLPEGADVAAWIPHLVKIFRRQLGLEIIEVELWQWLCICVAQHGSDLFVVES